MCRHVFGREDVEKFLPEKTSLVTSSSKIASGVVSLLDIDFLWLPLVVLICKNIHRCLLVIKAGSE